MSLISSWMGISDPEGFDTMALVYYHRTFRLKIVMNLKIIKKGFYVILFYILLSNAGNVLTIFGNAVEFLKKKVINFYVFT